MPDPSSALSLLDPPADVAAHPAVVRARALAADVLAPTAEEVDVRGVDRARVDAAAAAGLLGLPAPVEAGGGDVPPAVEREVTEVVAGACGATWFVLTQHKVPLVLVAASDDAALRERELRPLATGERLAGIALAHVRRPGPPPVVAEPAADGWAVSGEVGWTTSWGLADVVLLAAQTAQDDLVLALVPASEQPGLVASPPMALAAMEATRTVRLRLDGLHVPASTVAAVVPRAAFLETDRQRTANATPALFGLVRAAVRLLAETGEQRGTPQAVTLAAALAEEAAEVRARAYALVDDVPSGERVEERLAVRAHAGELATRTTAALVAARAGGGMARSDPAQRMAREALFHLVQAQTAPVRAAQLERFATRTAGG